MKKPTSPSALQTRAQCILHALEQQYPDAHYELDHKGPWQLVVSVVLSAQCTDAKVNQVTPALFQRFPTPHSLAAATPGDVEPFIRSLGLFRNKARNLVLLAQALVDQHQALVPHTREELEALPGVGRKSANVVLAVAFGTPALPVDTHVGRLAVRMGLSTHEEPSKVERDLCALWPESQWIAAHHALIWHGRRTCHARKPACDSCVVQPHCPQVGVATANRRAGEDQSRRKTHPPALQTGRHGHGRKAAPRVRPA